MPVSGPQPVITLTTDFGNSDHYVGTMKGVLLSRCPTATVVDITHQIPPFQILAGAYAIDQAAPYFPPATIHVVVVDPGVGTTRKPVLLEAGGMFFIAPDNGVLSLIARRFEPHLARELTNSNLFLPSPSATFHGRDIFAAVAGALAAQTAAAADVGPVLSSIEVLPGIEASSAGGEWRGIVLSVDHFGNAITNLPGTVLHGGSEQAFTLTLPGAVTVTRFFSTFGAAPDTQPFVYLGSSGFLEIGIRQQSAAAALQLRSGTPVTLTLGR